VQSLGEFQVRRGDATQLVPSKAWRREKSRQLFQLFLTLHSAPLDREQIFEHLWPDLDLDTAQRNFKVALNALYQVLEPNRTPGSESAYIFREGSVYGLRPYADVWLDTVAFEEACKRGEAYLSEDPDQAARHLEEAVELYRGEYLPGIRYEIWAAAERERLSVLFLRAADALCELYYQSGRMDILVNIAQRILDQDNCWERAYRYLMSAYDALGDHGQMARAYQRCAQVLRDELNVSPAAETERLFQQLVQKSG
jgi:LuxR family transcriptional regulator, maltose regulon positive regulatory protein